MFKLDTLNFSWWASGRTNPAKDRYHRTVFIALVVVPTAHAPMSETFATKVDCQLHSWKAILVSDYLDSLYLST